jgi:hypothetical protein
MGVDLQFCCFGASALCCKEGVYDTICDASHICWCPCRSAFADDTLVSLPSFVALLQPLVMLG